MDRSIDSFINQVKTDLGLEKEEIYIQEGDASYLEPQENGVFNIFYNPSGGDIRAIVAHELYHVYQHKIGFLRVDYFMRRLFWKNKIVVEGNVYLIEQGAIIYENYWRERLGLPLRDLVHRGVDLKKLANTG